MQEVGDEPIHCRERRMGATIGKGLEGEAQPPLARAQCSTLGGLALTHKEPAYSWPVSCAAHS